MGRAFLPVRYNAAERGRVLIQSLVTDERKFIKSKISAVGMTIELMALAEEPVTHLRNIYIKDGVLTAPTQLGVTYMDKLQWFDILINRGYRLFAGELNDESNIRYFTFQLVFYYIKCITNQG